MAKTKSGKKASEYFEDVLDTASKGGEAAIAAGYPELSRYTEAYLRGLPQLSQYGDAQQRQALARMGDMYGAYRRAGDYDMTNFRDIERRYGRAGEYDPTNYTDVERMYGRAGQYDPAEFDRADYTTENIKERMSPYEELVAKRATDRLQRQFGEAKASRDLEAARAGAFGGSGAAVAQEVARRNMQEQMADVNAQSLQAAYESAVQLYGKEYADNMAAQQAEEQSRQFGKQAQFQGIEGLMAARNAEEASRQFGAQMGMQGVAGQLAARQQQAGQVAAAKEAELAGLQGRSESARQQALLAEQRKNMQLANLAALQQGGQYQQDYNLARRMYPLDVAQRQAQVLGTGISGIPMQKPDQPSMYQNILGGVGAVGGFLTGLGDLFRDGGVVYRGGGLAELEPEYYDKYER